MTNSPRLVHVASYVSVAEADAARMRLAMDDIPAWLSNAALVSWAWHYSNVTGGVKLLVSDYYAPHARIVLSTDVPSSDAESSHWTCPTCRAEVDGSWSYCWSCGTSTAGQEDPSFHTWHQQAPADRKRPRNGREILEETLAADLDQPESPGDRLVVRMWAASVFGIVWSPLFLLVALYYVHLIGEPEVTLRPIDRCRYRIAWICLFLGVVLILWHKMWCSMWYMLLYGVHSQYMEWLWLLVDSFDKLRRPPLY